MKFKLVFAVASALLIQFALADLCALGSEQVDGNVFCQAVNSIQYSNVGTPGQYNRITYMGSDGTCQSTPKHFSGPNSPLDGEVSVHIRGPAQLNEFAVYIPSLASTSTSKRSAHRHQHRDVHKHSPGHTHVHGEVKNRQEVTATIDGQILSWGNDYWGPSNTPTSDVMVTATIDGQVVSWRNNWFGPSSTAPVSQATSTVPTSAPTQAGLPAIVGNPAPTNTPSVLPSSPQSATTLQTSIAYSAPSPASSTSSTSTLPGPPSGPGFEPAGTFDRISYYNAGSQTVDNVTFLGNYGGQGSGVFDYNFGASLSYANCDGTGGAASSQILANKIIPSDSEVIIMRGAECGTEDCGYFRPGSVAYHGFDGADKVFMFDFTMPMDSETGFNGDMPAIWILNAEIPRTLQYGKPECNCWSSGCGEFDIAEALFDGSTFLKSTLHTNTPAGDSDYLARPTTGSMKLAVVFSSSTSTIRIQVLDESTEFPATLSTDDINLMCNQSNGQVSHFHVAA